MADGLKQAELALEQLPAVTTAQEVVDQALADGGALGPLLQEGTRDGLLLARDTVRMVRAELEREGAKADIRLLRLGNEAGLNLAKLSMRMAENEFQRKKGDAVERLIEAIAAEKETTRK